MTTLRWPCEVLRPTSVAFDIASRSLAAPASVSGVTQVVSTDAGIWKATYGGLVVKSRNAVIAHRAISALMEGRLGTILVPLCRAYQPIPDGMTSSEAAALIDDVPHEDDAEFDDGVGYVGGTISAIAAHTLAPRAVSMTILIDYGGTIEPGQHFSIGDRLYRLRTVNYINSTAAEVTFRPPLRDVVTSGDPVEFDDPVCRMRLAADDAMDLELALRRFGSPTVNFIEDL